MVEIEQEVAIQNARTGLEIGNGESCRRMSNAEQYIVEDSNSRMDL